MLNIHISLEDPQKNARECISSSREKRAKCMSCRNPPFQSTSKFSLACTTRKDNKFDLGRSSMCPTYTFVTVLESEIYKY